MSIFDKFIKRDKGKIAVVVQDKNDDICVPGYTSLDKNPEVMTACRRIAQVLGSIPIHLMNNTESGDERIVNELSRLIDINPMTNITRSQWIEFIVMTLLLYGKGNAVVRPKTRAGIIKYLEPIAGDRVSFNPIGYSDYTALIDGRSYDPDEVIHFTFNPDKTYPWLGQGVQVALKTIADNLKQAEATKKGFLQSKWKPSIIVKVDALTDEFSDPKKRQKVLDDYVKNESAGQPWIVPAEQFDIQTIKPLTLADLAISDSVEVDKRTVAAIYGVPPFLLGVGEYDKAAWNDFVAHTIAPIAIAIQQELTKKLIFKPEWYLKFNVLSLMDWDLKTISDVFGSLSDRGFITGNEVRDRIGMSPIEGLDEPRVLENYIPFDMASLQKKLVQEGESNE